MSNSPLIQRLSAISICGEDAAAFLQGQTTCDVRQVTPQQSSLGALCTPKGRVIATFRLMHTGEGYLLLLSRDLLEPVLKRLRMYVLRAKASLNDASGDWWIYGLIGDDLNGVLQQAGLILPDGANSACVGASSLAVRIAGQPARCLLLQRQNAATARPESLGSADENAWRLADIANGLPQIGATLSEAFIPQMLNLDLIGAISFQKGCYTGQEIVARTHYLGQSKRRMYRYSVNANPSPGDSLYAESVEEAVGAVVNAATDGSAQQLLAVVSCEYSNQPLRLNSLQGPILRALPLPYS